MVQWTVFAALTLLVLVAMLVLAHLTGEAATGAGTTEEGVTLESLSPTALLANVALTHGLFAGVLAGVIIWTGVPLAELGVAWSRTYLREALIVGSVLGIGLYALNEAGAATATRFGLDHDERLREMLAPERGTGWAVLLFLVLPVVASFEELLFRAALIGGLGAGFDVPVWALVVLSSVAFALGHGMQGSVGIVITGLLGVVLAVAFVLTGNLLVVIVAHYIINALEFLVHEGLGFDWARILGEHG